jgi:hypothetical protein
MAVRLSALRAGRPLPPGRFLVLISVRGEVDPGAIVRPDGLGKLKNPKTLGTETATFLLATQCLNQIRYRFQKIIYFNRISSLLICREEQAILPFYISYNPLLFHCS